MNHFLKRAGAFAMATVLSAGFCISGAFAAGTGNVDVTFTNVMSKQSEARKCLDVVNEFRTDKDNQWYWNEDNETKTETPDLGKLVYDYDLEKIAEQRAMETVINFSHTRPNGNSCFTAYSDLGYSYTSCGENIAAGSGSYYETAEEVVYGGVAGSTQYEGFAESNSDYDGQAHRRNLLDGKFTNIGMACVNVNGYRYWVMELSATRSSTNTSETAEGSDGELTATVEVASDVVSFESTNQELTMDVDSNKILQVNTNVKQTYPSSGIIDGQLNMTWSSSNESVATVDENGLVKALSAGSVVITGTCEAGTAIYEITVKSDTEPTPDEPEEHEHNWTIFYHWDDEEPVMWVSFYCENCEEFYGWYEGTVDRAEGYDEAADCTHGNIEAYVGYFVYTDSQGEEQWFYSVAGYEVSDPLDHTFGEPVFVWDYSDMTAEAVFTCDVCGFEESIPCTVTSEVVTEPDCTHEGQAVYTVTADFEGETYTTTEVRTISALGHDWAPIAVFHWNEDHTVCTATLTCQRCGETEDFVCDVFESVGAMVATLSVDGLFYTDEVPVESGTTEPDNQNPDSSEKTHEELVEELEAELEVAEGIDESLYKDDSAEALEEAIEYAKAVLADENATAEEIAEAITELKTAIEGLELTETIEEQPISSEDTGSNSSGSAGITVNGTEGTNGSNGSNGSVENGTSVNGASGNDLSSVSGNSANSSNGGNNVSGASSDGEIKTESAKTGSVSEWLLSGIALASACGLAVTLKKRKIVNT